MHAAYAAAGVKEVMTAVSEDTAELALLPSQPAAGTARWCYGGGVTQQWAAGQGPGRPALGPTAACHLCA